MPPFCVYKMLFLIFVIFFIKINILYEKTNIRGISRMSLNIKEQRLGQSNIARNGQKMIIVCWRNSKDIDVQFEDGTLVQHKPYSVFKSGEIRNPNVNCNGKLRIGQTNKSTEGLIMTIIAYRNKYDLDVQFEDGVIVTNKTYSNFLKGSIKHSQLKVGATVMAKNGQKMKIIAFRNHCDIDVQFEDGTIVTHVLYCKFEKGAIVNPNRRMEMVLADNRVGEQNIATNGQMMTIVAYHNSRDIDVQFEDGTVVTNKVYQNFQTGRIKNPNFKK